jgi:hypothetical protein
MSVDGEQHPYRLADGSILTITVAEYLSPGPQVRHLGSGLLPQTPCNTSPVPPSSSAASTRDSCIAAAEMDISTSLGWGLQGGEGEGLEKSGKERRIASAPQHAAGTAEKRLGSMGSASVGLRVPPANAISPNSLPPPPPPPPLQNPAPDPPADVTKMHPPAALDL